MTQTIIGVFDTYQEANAAVDALTAEGISRSNVEIHSRQSDIGESTSISGSDRIIDREDEGIFDKIQRFFSNLVGDDDRPPEYGQYQEAVRRGGALVSVDVMGDAELDRVRNIFESAGAVDIDERYAQWQSAGDASYTASTERAGSTTYVAPGTGAAAVTSGFTSDEQSTPLTQPEGEDKAFPVVQEELEVGKRRVQTGAYRVYSRPTETPVSESVNLREERASVERRPVDRPATEADLKEGFVEVRETQETPVVQKTARVVEEVVVGKQTSERTETVSDTVRGTQVDVERIDGDDVRSTGSRRTEADDLSSPDEPLKPRNGKI
ncbi:DUF2382 domain-containing protein [Candidimonas sp. SYP-B2681]|uniref:DUF2382 domain-containing protein n=1 Tax=Candidimonas sp. SYP-B2681 TaxID=2497686 RepID=UPI000F89C20D|nr:DUF2382 domain-containing protein [Candidimonas sp. SYP-B2681]RTZ41101.1 DUF2382 domain-containing protein [Candidimonas sp. SYP-B2681]